jgi:hypothetical protein
MTPHVSGWTEGMIEARSHLIAENIARTARGEPPLNAIDRVKVAAAMHRASRFPSWGRRGNPGPATGSCSIPNKPWGEVPESPKIAAAVCPRRAR